jgi:signal transduction histidine kinase
LKYLAENEPAAPDMVQAARRAADELVSINDGLLKVGRLPKGAELKPFAGVVEQAIVQYRENIRLKIGPQTGQIPVPASQFHLIIEELVRNAIKSAVPGRDAVIIIQAHEAKRRCARSRLIVEVIDNGVGMDACVLKNARTPFFSTRAGAHVGLGLTGIADMVRSMSGRLHIKSTPGAGTEVRISYPF